MKSNQHAAVRAVVGLTALLLSAAAVAAEAPASVAKIMKACTGCHGPDGVSTKPDVPTIAGISAFVHADALAAYKDGARTCDEKAKMMCGMSKRLTEEQIEAFGEYFASLPFKPAAQEFDAEKAAAGQATHEENCEICHTEGGSNPDDDASILAGQWAPYLRQSLHAFVRGEREQPDAMKSQTEGLTEADCEALVHYYASQQ